MKVLLRTGFVLWSCMAGVSALAEDRVIYGDDNRRDLFDPLNDATLKKLARSTAVLIKNETFVSGGNRSTLKLPKTTLRQGAKVCKDERFAEQINPGFCSGFLVGRDLLVTAGHCISEQFDCDETSVVFDFALDSRTRDLTSIPAANVYKCKSILKQEFDGTEFGRDYAVIKLDRPVKGRLPLKLRRKGNAKAGDKLAVIGHPSGLPTKIADGASVRESNSDRPVLIANLDTYSGNSGSAVFNMFTGEVEGILVSGETDYDWDPKAQCNRSHPCKDEECRGEYVTKTSVFSGLFP